MIQLSAVLRSDMVVEMSIRINLDKVERDWLEYMLETDSFVGSSKGQKKGQKIVKNS